MSVANSDFTMEKQTEKKPAAYQTWPVASGVSSAYMSQSTFLGQLPPSARVETVLKVEPAGN